MPFSDAPESNLNATCNILSKNKTKDETNKFESEYYTSEVIKNKYALEVSNKVQINNKNISPPDEEYSRQEDFKSKKGSQFTVKTSVLEDVKKLVK